MPARTKQALFARVRHIYLGKYVREDLDRGINYVQQINKANTKILQTNFLPKMN